MNFVILCDEPQRLSGTSGLAAVMTSWMRRRIDKIGSLNNKNDHYEASLHSCAVPLTEKLISNN